jgi:hypothetical protein
MVFLAAGVVCAGCSKQPVYAPPAQLAYIAPRPDDPSATVIEMNDPEADDHFVADIAPHAGAWRWTYDRPTLRYWLKRDREWRTMVRFIVADATFKDTGPVTVKFFVNDRLAGTQVCAKAGEYRFEKPVPADWLSADGKNTLAFEPHPVWVSPQDGQHLGVILLEAGFVAN